MARIYQGQPLLRRGQPVDAAIVRELQHDLRALGYHKAGLTGVWGDRLDAGVAALRIDLTHPKAPPLIARANAGGAVQAHPAGGEKSIEPALADCIARLMDDPEVTKLPSSPQPEAANAAARAALAAIRDSRAPTPFLAAMLEQESGRRHYDPDGFVVVGLDRNDKAAPNRITSRGYGMGQYTIFHHPPTPEELADFVLDPAHNLDRAFAELREKFDTCVISKDANLRADDHLVEHPLLKLRVCKYPVGDARRMTDCRNCALAAGKVHITAGTPVYKGAATTYQVTQYYPSADYAGVPNRADFGCDWPYAARRYNGGGVNSYHYQTRILLNLLKT